MAENFLFSELKYERPDFDELARITREYTEKMKNAKNFEEFDKYRTEFNRISRKPGEIGTLAFIRHTLDTSDEFYEKEFEYLQEKDAELSVESNKMSEVIVNSPFKDELIAKYGEQLYTKTKLYVDSYDERLVPFMQEQAKLTTAYQKLMATAKIPFKGQELNLYGIQKYFGSTDREERKEATLAYEKFYQSVEKEVSEIWDKLIKVRNEMGRTLGYENYIKLGYQNQRRTDYGREEVEAFRKQVAEEIVPLCTELYKAQAKRLGVDALRYYDEKKVSEGGEPTPLGDDDFMIETAKKMYHDLSPETAEFIDYMCEHDLMNLKNKPNKASTGYMTSLQEHKAPFVFACLNGTIFDMEVLSHELGHAFAGYRAMRNQTEEEYWNESTDIAEIHSMSMEQFAYPYIEMFYGKDADKYRFVHLQEAITFVPFGVAVDEFQHICYEKPELTPEERNLEWKKLEEKYMPWRKYADESDLFNRGGWWMHKLHIFQYPMYYINYTLTTVGAMEFKKRYAENKEEAWKDYLTLCDVGGSVSYLETLKKAKLSIPFEEGSVKRAMSYVKEILLNAIKAE